MINYESLFRISYGLYIVSSGSKENGNGFISNTVFQVTSDPPRFASCCNKDNHTAEIIRSTGAFSVSVLHRDTPPDIFGTFGYKSGKEINKMEGLDLRYGETGVPIVMNEAIAFLECSVVDTYDVGTHLMFIGELVQADILDTGRRIADLEKYFSSMLNLLFGGEIGPRECNLVMPAATRETWEGRRSRARESRTNPVGWAAQLNNL